MDLNEISKINIGFMLNGNYNPHVYNAGKFPAPYNKAVKLLQDNKGEHDKGQADVVLSQVLRLEEIEDCHEVAARQNGLGEYGVFDWVSAQGKAYDNWILGTTLERASKGLVKNDPVDLLPIFGALQNTVVGGKSGLVASSEIDETKYTPYMKCGYKPIDDIIGGIPTDGPIIVLGLTGAGKSYFAYHLVCSWLREHPDKTAAIYTLEMPAEHYKWRSKRMFPMHNDIAESNRLLISGSVKDVNELQAEVSAMQVDFVVVDDLDGLVTEETPGAYQAVYKRVKEICRFLGIPVLMLAQTNREISKAKRFLGLHDASWSSAAEKSAAMFITLNYVDPNDPEWQDNRFPIHAGNNERTPRLFICFWKFRENRDDDKQQGLGAIRIEPNKLTGRYDTIWVGEAYQNKLFPPNHAGAPIGGARPASEVEEVEPVSDSKQKIRLNKR